MRAALTIGLKDLRQRLRDRSAYVVGIVAPLALVLVLVGTIGSASEDSFGFAFAVADEDGGEVAAAFVGALDELAADGLAWIRRVPDRAAAAALVSDDEVGAAFVVPAGFTDAVLANQPAGVVVIGNPNQEISTEVARSVAAGFAAEVNAVQVSVGAVAATGQPPSAELIARAVAFQPQVSLAPLDAEGSGFDFATYYAAGMTVFFLFFTVQFAVLSLIEEREMGTMDRLLAAPMRPAAILVGKTLSAFAVGVVSMAVLVVATTRLVGADWGNSFGVALLIMAAVLAAMGIVALVATLARTSEQARGYAQAVAIVLGLFGGVFFPVALGPDYLDRLSLLTPHRWMLDGVRDLSFGEPVTAILPAVAALLVYAAVTGGLGVLRSRKLVRSR